MDYCRIKNRTPISMTKEEFKQTLKFIAEHRILQDQFVKSLENLCKGNYCDCWLYINYEAQLVEKMQKLMNDQPGEASVIEWFLYDTDNDCPYKTSEELYDSLKNRPKEKKPFYRNARRDSFWEYFNLFKEMKE